MRWPRTVLLAVAFPLAACGSRTSLLDATAGRTSTPSSSSSSTGAGGVGGAGGGLGGLGGAGGAGGGAGSGLCANLTWADPIMEVEEDDAHFARQPLLTASSDDGAQVTVAFQELPVEGPGPFVEMRHATIHPWNTGPLPDKVGPTFGTYASPDLVPQFAVGGAPGGRFGLLVSHGVTASFSPRVDPLASDGGPTVGIPSATPVFVARSGGLQIVGATLPGDFLITTLVREGGGSFDTQTSSISCSKQGISARAVPYGDGFLVVSSNGANNANGFCASDPASAGPPSRIDVFLVRWDASPEFVMGIDAVGPVAALEAVPHKDGAWVVWRWGPMNSIPPLRWARLSVASAGVVGPGDVTDGGDAPFGFTATDVGGLLAVAWKSDPANNPPDLVVRLLHESGAVLSTATLQNPPMFAGPTSMIASPAGDSMLIAWNDQAMLSRVHLARLDCWPGKP